ncbi:biotin/lipoyl-containing protein [Calorimonas adulescens]|uniref:Biotin/lipoyl-binding protein n=1 Tax=Calorimonas adulescens TaxID=2606906 RepID=A0A5D8QDH8_9THEO|nr:biotin/lipoyl-containing protein [Calorimonas adulescens]TZE81573.1 biotin/lipoyl-binding protein [Calorimonas adulescens]
MKKYRVTVNGNTYEVEVEELAGDLEKPSYVPTSQPAVTPTSPVTPKPAAPQPRPQSPKPAAAPGAIASPMPGTILDVKIKEGDEVEKGQVLMILEAMKMENEIIAPSDGKVKAIYVQKGASVNTGDPLVELS